MFQKSLPLLCRAESSEVSTREKEGTPRLTPRGDSRRVCTKTFLEQPPPVCGCFKKAPYSVVPSVSEASTPHFVLPRVAWHPKGKKGDLSADASGLHRVRPLASLGGDIKGSLGETKIFLETILLSYLLNP
jgi:hypothetical protein